MRYRDIICVGGPLDGSRRHSDAEWFEASQMPDERIHRTSSSRISFRPSRYELVAIDFEGLVKFLFFKEAELSMQDAVSKIMENYRPYDRRYRD